MPHMIQDFFSDRTRSDTLDFMYPMKIKTKTPRDLLRLFFDKGESTSIVIDGLTFNLTVPDGCPFLSSSHTSSVYPSKTFSNIISGQPPLSLYAINEAKENLKETFSIADTLITYSNRTMCQKANEVIREIKVMTGCELEHVVIPREDIAFKYRWFLVDSRKAAGHYKKLDMDYHEIAMMDWSWAVASLSTTEPGMNETHG